MIFVDTSAFLALEDRRDAHHAEALDFRDDCFRSGEALVTSDYVLDESYTIIRRRTGHGVAVGFGEDIRGSRLIRVEHVTHEVVETAWRLFKTYDDHDFSFTDCTCFALMQHLRIDAAFAFDKHFREYGKCVVKP